VRAARARWFSGLVRVPILARLLGCRLFISA